MSSIGDLLAQLLQIYQLVLLARVLLSWFPDIDRSNAIVQFLYDVTEPVLEPVRRRLPRGATIDFSPLVVFFGLSVLSMIIRAIF
ncbi:MAG: YggT family protein [Anaerolineae bacterium]|nr:YggT family protein [Anaerolineae bacterium]